MSTSALRDHVRAEGEAQPRAVRGVAQPARERLELRRRGDLPERRIHGAWQPSSKGVENMRTIKRRTIRWRTI